MPDTAVLEQPDAAPPPDRPAPTAVTGRSLPALNGLRGIAVIAVVAYHLEVPWARGGYLGVDLFFVLSGFLITSLLLEEWVRTSAVRLGAFWGRRAKRLLPALFLVVAALGVYLVLNARFGGPGANGTVDLSGLRGDALSTLLYVSNWHAIFAHESYFAQFQAPSPLAHTWSLAIEEQFYLVWPPLLLVVLLGGRAKWRPVGLVISVVLALASAALMGVLFVRGVDANRIYFGTDTRAFDLMAGCAVAFLAAGRAQPGPRARRALHAVAPLAGAALAVAWVYAGTPAGFPSRFMFEGGFALCAALAAVVVADARLIDQGRFSQALSLRPLRFLGVISYGVYLWHWPVIVYVSPACTGLSSVPLDAVRIAATLVLATASYYLVERPIRRATLPGALGLWLAPLAGVLTAVLIVVATIPAVAAPGATSSVAAPVHGAQPTSVPGAGGDAGQARIVLPASTVISAARPLRVLVLGDSVIGTAEPAITAALESTGSAVVFSSAIDGFGLTTVPGWRTSIPQIIARDRPDLIIGAWSWDDAGPSTPNALHQPLRYRALMESFLDVVLAPGNGVAGVAFTSYPRDVSFGPEATSQERSAIAQNAAGTRAWATIAAAMPAVFAHRVMYLPVARSLTYRGTYLTWLPPSNDPGAPKRAWLRARMQDHAHLCPEGALRYADAVLSDLRELFGLPAAQASWFTSGWSSAPEYETPPGACPSDHPPS